jgi:hypothetical protein
MAKPLAMEAIHKSSISTLNKPNGNDSSHYCKACSTACLHSKEREQKNEKMMGYEDHLVHIHHSWMHYIHQLAIHRPGCCLKYIEPDSYYELISISIFFHIAVRERDERKFIWIMWIA